MTGGECMCGWDAVADLHVDLVGVTPSCLCYYDSLGYIYTYDLHTFSMNCSQIYLNNSVYF